MAVSVAPVPKAPIRVFVALSGGGAKGIIHVGALKALEDAGVFFEGFSGTSAGAIVAALHASGFTSDQIVDPVSGHTIFDRLREQSPLIHDATSLFGRAGWWRVQVLRFVAARLGGPAAPAAAIALALLLPAGALLSANYGEPWGWLTIAAWLLVLLTTALAFRMLLGGLAALDGFGRALDRLLTTQLFPDQPNRRVRLADYGRDGRPSLKIVASDLSGRRLKLFSPERTPEDYVVDAVRASIAIPFLFRLPVIGGRTFADGGLVSNLPAWGFDEERELDPDAYTVAIDIADTPARAQLGRRGWLVAAVRTAIFGSAELNLRAVGRAERITLGTDIGLLDFGLPKARYLTAASQARDAATAVIVNRLIALPALYQDACALTVQLMGILFDASPNLLEGGRRTGRVRCALAMPDAGYAHSLRLRHSVGYTNCTDDRLLLPIDGSVAGAAYRSGNPSIEVAPLPPGLALPGPANAHRRTLVWPEMAWTICLPIFPVEPGGGKDHATQARAVFVVTIDGNEPLVSGAADAISVALEDVRRAFATVVVRAAQLETVDGYQAHERHGA